jgi:hypothetical protein
LQTRRWTNYFKVIENGESLWNVHRALNVAAFLISIVAMIIALSTKEFAKVNFFIYYYYMKYKSSRSAQIEL